MELSFKKKENWTKGRCCLQGRWWGLNSTKTPLSSFPVERNHQPLAVPALSTPAHSLLPPDAGHRCLPGLTGRIAVPCAPSLCPAQSVGNRNPRRSLPSPPHKGIQFIIAIKTLYAGFSQPCVLEVFPSPVCRSAGAGLGSGCCGVLCWVLFWAFRVLCQAYGVLWMLCHTHGVLWLLCQGLWVWYQAHGVLWQGSSALLLCLSVRAQVFGPGSTVGCLGLLCSLGR